MAIFKLLFTCCLALAWQSAAWATHERAGEITVEQTGPLTLRATITTYTKASSVAADRDSLTLVWGDGTEQNVLRSNGNGNGEILPNDVKYNIYVATHTYPARGSYTLSMNDDNRNGGILNVNYPNSDNISFFIQTTFTFFNAQFQGYNNSPLLLQPPVDQGFIGQPFVHNPNAFDREGDSLAYELFIPYQAPGSPVPNYQSPDQISPGPNNHISLDPVTGDLVWDSPQRAGEYNVAFLIKEYREGQLISSIVRDMQINILQGNNHPPAIEAISEICVVAGDTVDFTVLATDPDAGQLVRLTALGGPLQLSPSPATFDAPNGFVQPPVEGRFFWVPPCEVISDQHYQVVFKAEDNYFSSGDTSGLVTLKTVRIRVVGPPPKDVQAVVDADNQSVGISWESPYSCEEVADDYFTGFSVWRRIGSNSFELDTCTTGLSGKGYERIAFNINNLNNNRYFYIDNNIERGRNYCYRVLAHFARRTPSGNLYNLVESLPSNEACVQIGRDVPLMVNVSVAETGITNGRMEVRWTKPSVADLDTLQNPGPYRYQLWRAEGANPPDGQYVALAGASFTSQSFDLANDTFYIDNNINTLDKQYSYKVAFHVRGESAPLGFAQPASSVFLSIASTDERNVLTWNETTPWDNYQYVVYRENNATNQFDSIGIATQPTFTDKGLTNLTEYCYHVKSIGTYGISDVAEPLLNLSQIACGTPIDTVPPCPPVLAVANECGNSSSTILEPEFENQLSWTNPNHQCEEGGVLQYHVFYAPNMAGQYSIIETFNTAEDTSYTHQPQVGNIAGCYYVVAIDSVGNQSLPSNVVCIDNCPLYQLPTAFTPNGDGANDIFRPFPYRFVERVDFKVYNRWGGLVFETTSPDLLWNGTGKNGKELTDGVYFYTCQVFERRLDGVLAAPNVLNGYIHLLRGK